MEHAKVSRGAIKSVYLLFSMVHLLLGGPGGPLVSGEAEDKCKQKLCVGLNTKVSKEGFYLLSTSFFL